MDQNDISHTWIHGNGKRNAFIEDTKLLYLYFKSSKVLGASFHQGTHTLHFPISLSDGNIKISFTLKIREFTISLCFGKIAKFPVFSLTGNLFGHFPCFPSVVGTLFHFLEQTILQSWDTKACCRPILN